MRCSGGAGCLDCVTPFSSKMSFDLFIYLFFVCVCVWMGHFKTALLQNCRWDCFGARPV